MQNKFSKREASKSGDAMRSLIFCIAKVLSQKPDTRLF
jgi:hypothetical protein